MRLEGKTAVITGAGSGLGRACAELFAREGAQVVVNDYVVEAAETTVATILGRGGQAISVPGDVSRAEDVERLMRSAVEAFGRLDVLVNNAGIMPSGDHSVIDTPEEVWDRVLAVNVKGVYLCCRYAIPYMIKQGGGSIINMGSVVSFIGCTVPQDAYTASKGAVEALTRSLAVQFAKYNIRVNTLCPGPIETALAKEFLTDEAARQLRLRHIPLGRFGSPEDVARAALYLASSESDWVTGISLLVDGGLSILYF